MALCTSFFFVASLVHIPIGPTSVHLSLIGLVGIMMGPFSFLPILFGLVFQALLFQEGGITALGANALTMGLPAYAAYWLFRLGRRLRFRGATFAFGFMAGGGAVALALVLLKFILLSAGESFAGVAWAIVIAHIPLALVEALLTGFAAELLKKVEPGVLEAEHA